MKALLLSTAMVGTALVSLACAPRATASDCTLVVTYCPETTQGGYTYRFDGANLVKAAASREQRNESDGRVLEYVWIPDCANAGPDDIGAVDGSCFVAISGLGCPPGEVPYDTYWRELAPNPTTAWNGPDPTCRAAAETWSIPELTALIEPEFRQALVEEPRITLNPSPRGLVQLPVIANVEPLADVGFAVTNPVPGDVAATPSYAWSFGEGSAQEGPGRAYDGTSPTNGPAGYYVAHTYRQRGAKTVTLTVTWQGEFTVAGLVIPLDPIELDYPQAVDVVEARSQLVAGDG